MEKDRQIAELQKGCDSARALLRLQGEDIHERDQRIEQLEAENARLKTELSTLKKRLEESPPVAWMARDNTSDEHYLFAAEPQWDSEYEQWLSVDLEGVVLGSFDSYLRSGKSCPVRLVRVVD
jgi:hypothetical protein